MAAPTNLKDDASFTIGIGDWAEERPLPNLGCFLAACLWPHERPGQALLQDVLLRPSQRVDGVTHGVVVGVIHSTKARDVVEIRVSQHSLSFV